MHTQRLLNCTTITFFLLIICAVGKVFAAPQPYQNTVDFRELKKYADYAYASYQTAAKIRALSLSKGSTITHFNNIPEIEISYFLVTNDANKTQIIVIRGTSNIENAIVDVAVKLMLDKHANVRLHNGFSQAAEAIYAEIQPQIKKDYVISTTGHSMGGAIALILAMYLDNDHYKIGRVVTFGQPKVTNIAGASKFQHLNVIRLVTPKDLVPLMPPFDLVDLNSPDIYWHSGKEVILLADATYAVLDGVNSMMRATKFTQEPLDENNIKHHQMALYLELVTRKIHNSKLVSFTNNFNLFNLFGTE